MGEAELGSESFRTDEQRLGFLDDKLGWCHTVQYSAEQDPNLQAVRLKSLEWLLY